MYIDSEKLNVVSFCAFNANLVCMPNFTWDYAFECHTAGWMAAVPQLSSCTAQFGGKCSGKVKTEIVLVLLCTARCENNTAAAVFFLWHKRPAEGADLLHCGIEAAVGAVAFSCIRCLNSKGMFREEGRI